MHLLATYSLRYIQRCFSDVAKTENFTQIDFTAVKKLLSSPELNITSELEIMKAADTWISYNYDERSKFAKDLLLTVRLNLLPDETLRKILRKSYHKNSFVFQRNKECIELASVILQDKKKFFDEGRFLNNKTRYCCQNEFNILICGGVNYNYRVIKSDIENPQKSETLTQLVKHPHGYLTSNNHEDA